jgi:hypothetical protein
VSRPPRSPTPSPATASTPPSPTPGPAEPGGSGGRPVAAPTAPHGLHAAYGVGHGAP